MSNLETKRGGKHGVQITKQRVIIGVRKSTMLVTCYCYGVVLADNHSCFYREIQKKKKFFR